MRFIHSPTTSSGLRCVVSIALHEQNSMDKPDLATQIAQRVVKEFDAVNAKSGKPAIRPNGDKEWTVLAGLVALENDAISVLTLATGVKAMPDQVRKYSQGWIVHDMHAEILCIRAFNWLLVEEMKRFPADGLDLLEMSSDDANHRFKLRKNIKLALYISEPPCGDASMSHIASDGPLWEEPPAKKVQLLRGRAHFNKVGVVRTKPGRADSLVTLSKSCSDKLCIKQFTGILNCISSVLMDPVYLDYLVIHKDKYREADFDRCFKDRLKSTSEVRRQLKVLPYAEDHYQFHKTPERIPLQLSLVFCVPTNTIQVINNGAKNGGYVKKKPPKPSGASMLCKRKLLELASPLLGEYEKYFDLKVGNDERQERKRCARAQLDNWPEASPDDFEIE